LFQTLAEKVPQDKHLPDRAWKLDVLQRVLDGTIYDLLPYPFHVERHYTQEYIPLRDRAPSVRVNFCRVVVEDTAGLTFGDNRFPAIYSADETTREGLKAIVKDARLPCVMIDAVMKGSVGSVAILLRILKGRVFPTVLETKCLTPVWDPEEPDKLLSVTEKYRADGKTLQDSGWDIAADMLNVDHWFRRDWTGDEEIWFTPLPVKDETEGKPFVRDEERTVQHRLGFCPVVWIKNLPGPSASGDPNDGACTFRSAIETQIECDYQLSQAGRGLKYSSDPTLLIKEPAGGDDEVIRSAGNALVVSKDGDAKLLEIGGTAVEAVLGYVKMLREMALESIHGNRSNADKVAAAQSGRALEMLHQPLICVADKLRTSYGEHGLLCLMNMIIQASQKYPLRALGKPVTLSAAEPLSLKWTAFFNPTWADRQLQGQTLEGLRNAGLMSRETAVGALANEYDIEDVSAEINQIEADEKAQDARLAAQQAKANANETVEE
jgi:Phage portal protein, SPP1 Gp6-like